MYGFGPEDDDRLPEDFAESLRAVVSFDEVVFEEAFEAAWGTGVGVGCRTQLDATSAIATSVAVERAVFREKVCMYRK